MTDVAKKKMGRPSAYKEDYAKQALVLCELGATDVDLARAFGVSEKTINTWKKKHPDFLQSLKGKQSADDMVKMSLFKRATGQFSIPDSDIRVIDGTVVITPLEKHFPPDVTACIFWLQNRDKENWKPRKAAEEFDEDNTAPPMSVHYDVKAPVGDVKVIHGKDKGEE